MALSIVDLLVQCPCGCVFDSCMFWLKCILFPAVALPYFALGLGCQLRNSASPQCVEGHVAVMPCLAFRIRSQLLSFLTYSAPTANGVFPQHRFWKRFTFEKHCLFLFSMVFRFTKPQAELYQAVLDIQKSCLSLCSPGMSLENIYSLMLSLIGQKLKELDVLKSSITESHFFKVLDVFYSSFPLKDLTVFPWDCVSGPSLAQESAFQIHLLLVTTHCATVLWPGFSTELNFSDKAKLQGKFQPSSV